MLLETLQSDLKNAQLDRDEVKVSTLRLLLSEVKNGEIAKGQPLADEDIISIISKEVKRRKEAAAAFRAGDREESALREEAELKVLESYLPAQLSAEELTRIVEEVITETGAVGVADMGKVIGIVMGKVRGQAEGSAVSAIVREKLIGTGS